MKNNEKKHSWLKNALTFALIVFFGLMVAGCPEDPPEDEITPPSDKARIYIANNQFMVNGNRIWMNGVNTPWNNWNDFGGSYNNTWWDTEFGKLKSNGINATRIWINCDSGTNAITLNADGTINNVSSSHWNHLDQLFTLATKHKIYIMATLTSFDHFKKQGGANSAKWVAMLNSDTAIQSFADKYTKEFVSKYKNNPYLWSIDMMNEPDWVSVDESGDNSPPTPVQWARLQKFFAINASVIHANSDILVTVGMAMVSHNSDSQGTNHVSDARLNAQYNIGNPTLDFWAPHYYSWNAPWFGVPHYLKPSGAKQGNTSSGFSGGWGLDASKPAVLAECSAKGTINSIDDQGAGFTGKFERDMIASSLRPPTNNITTDYEYAYNNGWQGVMAWTSNGVDGNGGITGNGNNDGSDLGKATKNMAEKHHDLIYPSLD